MLDWRLGFMLELTNMPDDEPKRIELPQVSATTTESKSGSSEGFIKNTVTPHRDPAEASRAPLTVARYAVDMLENLGSTQVSLWAISNALTESRVLHARELCDIVLSKEDRKGKDNDDILLKHLVPEDKWTEELNGLVSELRTKYGGRDDVGKPCWLFNKLMFHPTTKRSKSYDYTKALAVVEPLLDKIVREIERITKRPIASSRM